jgi:hypothetical protein
MHGERVFRPHKQCANQDMKGGRNWAQFGLIGTETQISLAIAFLLRGVESVAENRTAPVGLHGVSLIQASLQELFAYAYPTTH